MRRLRQIQVSNTLMAFTYPSLKWLGAVFQSENPGDSEQVVDNKE